MLSSLSSSVSRTPTSPAAVPDLAPLASVIDLAERRARYLAPPDPSSLHITPELLAALGSSWGQLD